MKAYGRKIIKLAVTFIVIIVICFVLVFFAENNNTRICFENTCFLVEIANTPEKRQKGLMGVESLSENRGMFFVFEEEGEYSFWMKNTLIPLDIIWLNEEFEVVDIQIARPCEGDNCISYIPNTYAKYVLEINAGMAQNRNISQGSIARVEW